jgi:hypothetical protein
LSTQATVADDGVVSTSSHLTAATHTLTASGAVDQLGYAISYTTGSLVVNKLALTGTAIAGVTTTYGTPAAAGAVTFGNVVGSDLVNSAASIDSPTYSAGGNLNAGSYTQTASTTLTNTDSGNYSFAGFTSAANYNVGRLSLAVGGVSGVNKVYDANNVANLTGTAAVSALSNDDVALTGFGLGTFGNQNVGNRSITVTGYTLSGADAGNYNIVQPTGVTANITAAPLVITANADAKIITQADNTAGYNGVSYSGFVGGETSSVVSAGSITRTGMGAASGASDAAGNYTGVLVPGGYSSGNYNITYANGNYTIVPADTLLVKVTNASTTYGVAPTFSITSAQYLNGSNVLTSLTQSSASGNTSTWADTAGGSATFTIVPSAASTSTSGNYVVGNYAITGGNTNIVGSNFTSLSFVGNLAVNQQALIANASNVSKVYDSTTSMSGVTLGLSGLSTNDLVTVGGTGAFSSKNAGSGLGYSISNLVLSGTDAANYYLSGGGSFSGSNGVITPAPLTISGITASNKVYNASTAATVNTAGAIYSGLFGGDQVTVTATGVFGNRNAGTGKTVTLTSGYQGLDMGNYLITDQVSTTADITPAPLYVTGTTVSNKVYDGTAIAKLTGGVLSGTVYSGDDVTLATQAGSFASGNVGLGIAVTASDALGGASAGNYTLIEPTGLEGNIVSVSVPPAVISLTGPSLLIATQPFSIQFSPSVASNQVTSSDATANDASSPGGTGSTASTGFGPGMRNIQVSGSDVAASDASSSGGTGSASSSEVNVKMTIGDMGPTLKIENGGIKLPDNIVSVQLEKHKAKSYRTNRMEQL